MFKNMENKICIVTGSSSGIGKGVAKAMAQRGAKVIMVSRDKTRGKESFKEISAISNNVEWIPADLCSVESIHKLVLSFKSKYSKLDILFNCAGDKIMKKYYTIDGFDGLFFSNYLGHFLLTNLLFEHLKNATPSKVITISGRGHKPSLTEGNFKSAIDLNDLQGNIHFSYGKYAKQATLAKIMFTYELSRRWKSYDIASTTLCPGLTHTNQGEYFPLPLKILVPLFYIFKETQTIEEGAAHLINLAEKSNNEINGKYFEGGKKGLFEANSSEESYDDSVAKKLWEESKKLLDHQNSSV
ncbi:SDR family NAD(P)-dependent oxidoreductase [Clostridium estertheticum]|uniref:SDR family NAD(P)-dependent oxidoreductase n=1 Tax=Clostridium estertheticum TaxID=238834 RepID=UPI001C6E5680|nr:SDR family NAD(P)-dependent oxidoreductase [Clostridium estertheticum]MBW9153468.1 SDR family NAD(P)-dependent oxidoreductase [Clostridium estertheticum]WLC86401.1 SDR family NAD(P)-dependent oxidoreductase [Clostridium estertheticum]